jgi:hypothetical protein
MTSSQTVSPIRSKTNWLVNLPLILLAISETLKDPQVMDGSPIPQSSLKWVLWGLAAVGVYLRNRAKNRALSTQKQDTPDLVIKEDTSGPSGNPFERTGPGA